MARQTVRGGEVRFGGLQQRSRRTRSASRITHDVLTDLVERGCAWAAKKGARLVSRACPLLGKGWYASRVPDAVPLALESTNAARRVGTQVGVAKARAKHFILVHSPVTRRPQDLTVSSLTRVNAPASNSERSTLATPGGPSA